MVSINKNKIIKLLGNQGSKPLKTNEILKKLGLGKEYKSELKRTLRDLYQNGQLKRLRGGRVTVRNNAPIKPDKNSYNAKARLIGKIHKIHKELYFVPRDDKLPTIELKNSRN